MMKGLEYDFNWTGLKALLDEGSPHRHMISYKKDFNPYHFMKGYGYDLENVIQRSEIFGYFRETLSFIKESFLEDNVMEDSLPFALPEEIVRINSIEDLLLMTQCDNKELFIWSKIIFRIMHIISLLDKDMRFSYFSYISSQISNKYTQYIFQEDRGFYLSSFKGSSHKILLKDFQIKKQKSRSSLILKFLHKSNFSLEDLYDFFGFRIITYSKLDSLKVLNFLVKEHVILPQNIKAQRSYNPFGSIELIEKYFQSKTEKELEVLLEEGEDESIQKKFNQFTSKNYKAIHITALELIRYKNPLYFDLKEIKKISKEKYHNHELNYFISKVDLKYLQEEYTFFYPYELQILDVKSYQDSLTGEASHKQYKRKQKKETLCTLFKELIELKGYRIYDFIF